MPNQNITTNSFKAWVLAARPKTLTGAASPVMVGLSMASTDGHIQFIPALLCFLFAFLMQIDANLINDYYDFKKGIDNAKRLGPKRACAEGWITVPVMRKGILLLTALSCLTGLPLVYYGGPTMILIGMVCVVFCFLYTTLMARKGLGDILVLVFFGLIPVCATYYIQIHAFSWVTFTLSLACGLAIDALLIVNNYRDRETDAESGKITLAVKLGEKGTERLYLWTGIAAVLLCQILWFDGHRAGAILPMIYLFPHILTWKYMVDIKKGVKLNRVLGQTARNMFFFGILLSVGLLI
ncbi:MAG TPA: 1,4-dihydroxy-2-naphthoate octaprenyltransferase [Candidatus Paraprevotella stercorigallinarum]|jgi:1,4-dihydroxy-2-naphthoate octaprenyltransferase|nr:1,4-dihydroxy-2-naphthoate octaprenyltransferase [Candidatus Paraprevotella stercorigallinarum]